MATTETNDFIVFLFRCAVELLKGKGENKSAGGGWGRGGGCVVGSLEVTGQREKDLAFKEKEKWGVGGRRHQVQGQESGMEGQVLPYLQQRSLVPSRFLCVEIKSQ